MQITLTRLVLGAAVLTAVLYARGQRLPTGRAVWGHLVVAALFANAVPYLLFAVGQQHVDSGVAGALNATTPLWAVLIGLAADPATHLGRMRVVGVIVGFVGTLLIFSPWQAASDIASWGGLACLAAAASYGISYVYMNRYLVRRGTSSLALSGAQLIAATGWLALATPFAGLQPVQFRVDVITAVLILGALGTGLAYVLNYRLIADEGIAASLVSYPLPVVAVALGALVLNEPLTGQVLGGMAIVLIAIALSRRQGELGGPGDCQDHDRGACRCPLATERT